MKILLVTKGDATKRRTWSGVPYLVRERFMRSGHKVVDFNIFDDFWFHAVGALWNLFHDHRKLEFESTIVGGWLLARAVANRCNGYDKVVALTFALDAKSIAVPVILMHDWTLGYFWKRWDRTEVRQIERMRNATRIQCFYPASAEYLRSKGLMIDYIELPVDSPDEGCQVRDKDERRAVVFASPWHQENLIYVLDHMEVIADFDIVDVIGCHGSNDGKFVFHGFLDKDVDNERRLYWDIIAKASVVIAMGNKWPGGSSIAEAKRCGCRIITRDWPDLKDILEDGDKDVCDNIDNTARCRSSAS